MSKHKRQRTLSLTVYVILSFGISCKQQSAIQAISENEGPPQTIQAANKNESQAILDSSVAVVVDKKGLSTSVNNLKAKYEAGGQWIGRKPMKLASSVSILLHIRESDYITTKEVVDIPFSSIKRISFLWSRTADEEVIGGGRKFIQEGFDYIAGHIIERRDGTTIKLDREGFAGHTGSRYEEFSATKEPMKSYVLKDYWFAFQLDDLHLYLEGFEGQAKTSDGKVGEFYMDSDFLSTIEFK